MLACLQLNVNKIYVSALNYVKEDMPLRPLFCVDVVDILQRAMSCNEGLVAGLELKLTEVAAIREAARYTPWQPRWQRAISSALRWQCLS